METQKTISEKIAEREKVAAIKKDRKDFLFDFCKNEFERIKMEILISAIETDFYQRLAEEETKNISLGIDKGIEICKSLKTGI